MKALKHLLIYTFVGVSFTAFAQTTTLVTQIDSTRSVNRTVERITSDFSLYVGFNNLGGTLPAGYDFRPIGSRFVALSWQKRIPLVVNGSTKLRLITGPEIAWNNFMFQGRNKLVEHNNQLVVELSDVELRKSKLVTTQINLPVMLNLSFRSGLSWSVGAYAGMRLDSYTKVKPEGGPSVRLHNSYNLSPLRWGLTTEIGFRNMGKLFVRYEPNSPFRAGEGPGVSVWAAGIKL